MQIFHCFTVLPRKSLFLQMSLCNLKSFSSLVRDFEFLDESYVAIYELVYFKYHLNYDLVSQKMVNLFIMQEIVNWKSAKH